MSDGSAIARRSSTSATSSCLLRHRRRRQDDHRRPCSRSKAPRRGRDAVVVTIDPAKRLADTLGLEHLSNTPHEIARALWDPDGTARRSRPAATR